jgi:hypothetical protein
MAAVVVDGKNTIVNFENGDVLVLRCDGNASAFKQIGLGGHVNPVAHS